MPTQKPDITARYEEEKLRVQEQSQLIYLQNQIDELRRLLKEQNNKYAWAVEQVRRVAAGKAPSADYTRDADFVIKRLHANANEGEVIEADGELTDLIRQYEFVSREAASMEELKQATRADLLARIGTASKVKSDVGIISCGMTKPSQGTLVTQEMVGTYVGARQGYRNFRFTPKKGD